MRRTKRFAAIVGVALLILASASASKADDDQVGERVLRCFHPNDRHMETSCEPLADEDVLKAALSRCSGTPIKFRSCNTSYRGGWVNAPYKMRTESSVKFSCEQKDDGTVVATWWMKTLNVADSKTPEPCSDERWHVVKTFLR